MSNDSEQIPTVKYGAGIAVTSVPASSPLQQAAVSTNPPVIGDGSEYPRNDPTKRAGYEYDPYSAGGQSVPLYPGLPITYRDIHISEVAFADGFTAKSGEMPPVPPLWSDKAIQYAISWKAGYAAARLAETDSTGPQTVVPTVTIDPRIGYTIDPFSGPEYLVDVHDARIPYHNKRQQEISHIAREEGAAAKSPSEIPNCPPMFQDVQHYWDTSAIAGFESTHSSRLIKIKAFLLNEFMTRAGSVDWWSTALKVGMAFGGALIANGTVSHWLDMIGY